MQDFVYITQVVWLDSSGEFLLFFVTVFDCFTFSSDQWWLAKTQLWNLLKFLKLFLHRILIWGMGEEVA